MRSILLLVALIAAFMRRGVAQVPPTAIAGVITDVPCPFDSSKALLAVTCGRMKVPENYDDTKSRSIEIAFMIVKASQNIDPENPVLFLNGGPGGASLLFTERLVTASGIRASVVDRDWVFFDQRGAGRSIPALYCAPEADYFKQIVRCRDQLLRQDIDLSQYTSARIARDVEALRKALGAKQWNLWGASYGSRLALTIARYYPSSVRSVVHDGPYLPEEQEVVGDFQGTEVAIDKLFSKCAADSACASTFPQLRSRFLAALPRLRQQAVSAGAERFDDNRVVRFVHDWLYGAFRMPFEHRIRMLLTYADAAARGDAALMLQTQQRITKEEQDERKKAKEDGRSEGVPFPVPFPVQASYQLGQGLSIDCNEEKPFESMDEYVLASHKSEIVRSLFGSEGGLWNFKQCAFWPSGRADAIENTHVYFDGPQLVFTGELDASLSGIDGYRIAMLYANATNVVFSNGGHIQATMEESSPREYNYYRTCALTLARKFLADPHRTLDTRCAEARKFSFIR